MGFPCGSAGKESGCNAGDLGSIPGSGRSPGEGKGYPPPVFWPEEFYGLYSPWHRKELDTTEQTSLSLSPGGSSPADTLVLALEDFWISDLQSCKSLEREVFVQTFTQLNSCGARIPVGSPVPILSLSALCRLLGAACWGYKRQFRCLEENRKNVKYRGPFLFTLIK